MGIYRTFLALTMIVMGTLVADGQTLPGGANSLQEAHGDWRVACAPENTQTKCAISQQLFDKDSRQRILAIELHASTADQAIGTIVLPFGLTLEKGITLQIDEAAKVPPRYFRTCLPTGCIVPVTFDSASIAAMRSAHTLSVKATGDIGQEIAFVVSLNGFGSALDRAVALSK
jgi:invasion protein IalB